jgi:hypothetical protein
MLFENNYNRDQSIKLRTHYILINKRSSLVQNLEHNNNHKRTFPLSLFIQSSIKCNLIGRERKEEKKVIHHKLIHSRENIQKD